MFHVNRNINMRTETLFPQTLYRGLYVRVAKKLGVDPSYVSRVARGERSSKSVENLLRQEVSHIGKQLDRLSAVTDDEPRRDDKRLRFFITRQRHSIRQEWLSHSQADPGHRKIKLPKQERTLPILLLIDEALKAMKFTPKEMALIPMRAAMKHGGIRRSQGYTVTSLVEDYNLIRRCISALAEKNIDHMDRHLLLHDLAQLGEVFDIQLQKALRNFLP